MTGHERTVSAPVSAPGMAHCAILGCGKPVQARGWCHTHYEHWRRKGTPVYVPPTLEERFLSKVVKSPGCWTWTAAHTVDGYGQIVDGPNQVYAHRVAHELYIGPIPAGYQVDHLCRNTACVNPAHLEAVTQRENILRGSSPAAEQAKRTHCPQGHPLRGENLYQWRGQRHCRQCRTARMAVRRRQTRRAA